MRVNNGTQKVALKLRMNFVTEMVTFILDIILEISGLTLKLREVL